MKLRITQVFPMVLMFGLAVGTFWLDRLVQLPPLAGRDKLRHDPDFIVEGFTVTQMDATGRPETSLSAPKMLHYPDDESTVLENPRFIQHSINQPAVEMVGNRGTVSKDGDLVRIEGDVRVTRAGYDQRPPMTVETSLLDIEPNTHVARTNEAVVITEGASKIRGVGMMINRKSREFELNSRVQVTLPPATKR